MPAPLAPAHNTSFDGMSRKQRNRFQQALQILGEAYKHPDPDQRWVGGPTFAKSFACKLRTVYRYMDAMRDDHQLPIESRKSKGYRLYESISTLPTIVYTQLETVALCVSMGSMTMFDGTPLGKPARSIAEKIHAGLCNDLALTFDAVAQRVSFHCTGAESQIDPATFSTLLPALIQHQELEIEYVKGPAITSSSFASSSSSSPSASSTVSPSADLKLDGAPDATPGLRRIEPLHLACIDYGWYLLAWDPAQNDIRNFALRRIRSIRPTGQTCAPRPFDIKEELQASFGAYRSSLKDAQVIRLRFWGAAAQIIPEFIWHRTQQFTPMASPLPHQPGAIEMKMEVVPNPKLIGWIKQWLGEVLVLEPATLRDDVRQAAEKGAADQAAIAHDSHG